MKKYFSCECRPMLVYTGLTLEEIGVFEVWYNNLLDIAFDYEIDNDYELITRNSREIGRIKKDTYTLWIIPHNEIMLHTNVESAVLNLADKFEKLEEIKHILDAKFNEPRS